MFAQATLMSSRNVILVGGPDTGKTNFIGRLWIAVQSDDCALSAYAPPDDIRYVEEVVASLYRGQFAPRTNKNLDAELGSLVIPVALNDSERERVSELVIPDISGEIWEKAVETSELPSDWMERLETADAALLFVRVLSDTNSVPIDWVSNPELMQHQGDDGQQKRIPTQVILCELLRYLELQLSTRPEAKKPRIAVVVTAWDLLDVERSAAGPHGYLQKEYPLFAGRLSDIENVDIMVFAMSIFGGDPEADNEFRDRLLKSELHSVGYVRFDSNGSIEEDSDITIPIAWAIGVGEI